MYEVKYSQIGRAVVEAYQKATGDRLPTETEYLPCKQLVYELDLREWVVRFHRWLEEKLA